MSWNINTWEIWARRDDHRMECETWFRASLGARFCRDIFPHFTPHNQQPMFTMISNNFFLWLFTKHSVRVLFLFSICHSIDLHRCFDSLARLYYLCCMKMLLTIWPRDDCWLEDERVREKYMKNCLCWSRKMSTPMTAINHELKLATCCNVQESLTFELAATLKTYELIWWLS